MLLFSWNTIALINTSGAVVVKYTHDARNDNVFDAEGKYRQSYEFCTDNRQRKNQKTDDIRLDILRALASNKIIADLKSCDRLFGMGKINQLNSSLANSDFEKQIYLQANFLKNNITALKLDS